MKLAIILLLFVAGCAPATSSSSSPEQGVKNVLAQVRGIT
jgi:hypothetical protein